ncbi:MAG: histidine kinase [Ginsengibacter sp.]
MVILWVGLAVLHITCFRFYSDKIVPVIRAWYGLPLDVHTTSFVWTFFYVFTQINMEASLAAAIRLGKMWYIKKQELDILAGESRKVSTSEAGKIQPVFMLNSLDKVDELSQNSPEFISPVIRKVKDLLVYVLYDGNQPAVDLNRELQLLEELIEIEKAGKENITVKTEIDGNINGEKIAPFIILPLAEYNFRKLFQQDIEFKTMEITIRLSDGNLDMKIKWNKPVDTSTLTNHNNEFILNINKRLQLLYPQSHKLQVVIDPQSYSTRLYLNLRKVILS